ncbi:putative transporter slc-17.2 [Babylonia areolata]|uniref:putative transporter slc-17.2 n=1 Tax=Babylonia areolata TaxID=304850 RepID=UPI003FD69C51
MAVSACRMVSSLPDCDRPGMRIVTNDVRPHDVDDATIRWDILPGSLFHLIQHECAASEVQKRDDRSAFNRLHCHTLLHRSTWFYAGAFLGFVFPALVCDSPVLGWPYIFYVSGGLSLLFVAVWLAFADNSPESSRWASQEEKNFIMACKQDDMGKGKIPWAAMARSGPLYAVAIGQTSGDVVIYLSITVAPAFFTDVLHTSRGYADFVCGIPFILTVPWTILFGRSLDVLRQRDLISTGGARRLAQGIANLGPAICYLLLTLMPSPSSHVGGVVVVYLLSLMALSCVTSGWMANMSDLAPKFVGAVCTMSQSLALWTAFVVPVFVDNLTVHKTREQWNMVFYIIAGLQVVCFVGYYILSSGEIQPWANVQEKSRPDSGYSLLPLEESD